jgi:hypothetical protein
MSLTQARRELERKLAQTKRLASLVGDPTTSRRLMELREELAEAIRKFPSRRENISEDEVRARAHDIWNSTAALAAGTKNFGFGLKGSL